MIHERKWKYMLMENERKLRYRLDAWNIDVWKMNGRCEKIYINTQMHYNARNNAPFRMECPEIHISTVYQDFVVLFGDWIETFQKVYIENINR